MIGRLQGTVLSRGETGVLVDVNGVGYEVEVPATALYAMPEPGQQVILHTHFAVREDAQLLYGFLELRERSLFRLLIRVNGVGPKLALGILSAMDSAGFVAAVVSDNVSALVKLPGIGRKTAERLIIEMRDRLQEWELEYGGGARAAPPAPSRHGDWLQEAEAALVSLGYKPQEASRAVVNAATHLEAAALPANTEQLIRAALKNLGRSTAGQAG